MLESLIGPNVAGALAALLQVLMIDLVLAGDNAVAVGLAAGGLHPQDRKKAILWGLIAAVALRIGFALITVQLLAIIGLLLAGGVLLLWVCWKMWRELHEQARHVLVDAHRPVGPLVEAVGVHALLDVGVERLLRRVGLGCLR